MQRAGQEGGTDTEHCHEHEHDGVKHTHCHDHEAGPEHTHWHDGKDAPTTPVPHEHEHEHEHGHEHAAPVAPGAPAAPAVPGTPAPQSLLEPRRAGDAFGTQAEEQVVGGIHVRWNGYVRMLAEVIEERQQVRFHRTQRRVQDGQRPHRPAFAYKGRLQRLRLPRGGGGRARDLQRPQRDLPGHAPSRHVPALQRVALRAR
ncbi:MAG: hypothetical protein H6730_17600 [Deltaproteobacteria bacterium]|nr:hypothetical protein [Deltaproteobacteria bacterium]